MVKKEITFIYADSVQLQVAEMIGNEAIQRGYSVNYSNDPFAKCEIGWYCDHINFPQYSKFSLIMLHDITQQYMNWPDIWIREPWCKYDIGFLPSEIWVNNWNKCSSYFYANTKKGVFLTGWPKADRLSVFKDSNKKRLLSESLGLDPNKPTILYAPAWENDHKQDEFVQAMLKLNVNILIKQCPWSEHYVEQIKNIKEMYDLHKNNPKVVIMDPKESILDAIMLSDVLVSEESSTMCEAVMLGKPAISVFDWLIPDTTPSRYPADNYEFAIKTSKSNLGKCVQNIIDNYKIFQTEAQNYSNQHFANIGNCIPMMIDILDSAIEKKESSHKALVPAKKHKISFEKWKFYKVYNTKRQIVNNYCTRYTLLNKLYSLYSRKRHSQNK